jgi:heptaprenyl diphosphate synthase
MTTKKLTLLSMLTAVGLILFVVEAQIPVPVPIPGIKLGLSNVVTLFALWTLGRKSAGLILFLRIVLGNLVAGNLMTMAYSLAGGLLCLLVMALLLPLFSQKQVWILSIFGAIGHNVGQLAIALIITATPSLLFYAPVLLLSGIITGFFTGQCAQAVLAHGKKLGW